MARLRLDVRKYRKTRVEWFSYTHQNWITQTPPWILFDPERDEALVG